MRWYNAECNCPNSALEVILDDRRAVSQKEDAPKIAEYENYWQEAWLETSSFEDILRKKISFFHI